jgi:hypothetical protein
LRRASKPPPVKAVSDDEVRALLDRYRCPVPFHAVRTRFLGNIASPVVSASPLDALKALWGGELPEFDSLDAVNELLAALIMGLWNRLSRHQERNAPFRLLRVDISGTREGLADISLIRRQELDGFIHGLFGKEESLELPERARRALTALSEMRKASTSLPATPPNPRQLTTSPKPSATSVSSRGSASVRSTRQCCPARGHVARRCARCRRRNPPCTDRSSWWRQFLASWCPADSMRCRPLPDRLVDSGRSGCVSGQCVGTVRRIPNRDIS